MAVRILDWDLCMKTVLDLLAQSMGNNDVENFFFVVLRPKAGHGLLILEVSISHTTTHHSR